MSLTVLKSWAVAWRRYWRHERRSYCRIAYWLGRLGQPEAQCLRCQAWHAKPPQGPQVGKH